MIEGDIVTLRDEADPAVSIIIIGWRLTDPLIECVRSLAQSKDSPPFEVILVLNGASLEVRAAISESVIGAKIVSLPANVGFGGGCNAGALVARGDYLVFLNDDCVVSEDWLQELARTAASPSQPAAVASVLLNVDGTIQEAGSRVLLDAGTIQFGAGMTVAQARTAGLLEERPVDYGSGAALLVRRDAFESIAGFDPLFEPAYFEDVDLCFRLQQRGSRTLLCPTAVVTHVSGGSTNKSQTFRRFAASRSGARFVQRWESVLTRAPLAAAPLEQLCSPASLAPVVNTRDLVVDSPEMVALSIANDYASWLNERLVEAEDILELEREIRRLEAARLEEVQDRLHVLVERLADLEKRSAFGLLRWQVGLLKQRHSTRRRK